MNSLFRILLIALYLPLRADIIVCQNLTDAKTIIEAGIRKGENTIIFSDLDDTILRPAEFHGSTPWFYQRFNELKLQGLPEQEALNKSIDELAKAYDEIAIVPVETTTASILNDLKSHVPVHGLTARSAHLSPVTKKHLDSIQVSFNQYHNAPELKGACEIRHEHGIFFVGNTSKAEVIKQLIAHRQNKPSKIIFIDDSKKHVDSVEKMMQEMGIECLAIHYTHVEESKPYGQK